MPAPRLLRWFGRFHGALFGTQLLRLGNGSFVSWLRSLNAPLCWRCHDGRLMARDGDWCCTGCGFTVRAASRESLCERALKANRGSVRRELRQAPEAARRRQRDFRYSARFYLLMAALLFAIGTARLYDAGGWMAFATWTAVSINLWVLGLRASYRHWQLQQRRLFEPGLFWRWFQHERWWI